MNRRRRARIAIVVDAPNWAFDGIARSIAPVLARQFDVEILYLSDYEPAWASTPTPGTASELFHEMFCGAYDLVHTFVRGFPERVFDPVIAAEPSLHSPHGVLDRLLRVPLTVNVHDHQFLDQPEDLDRARELFAVIGAGYIVSSRLLRDAIAAVPGFPSPAAVVRDGVEAGLYKPAAAERLRETGRPLVVGWVGNAHWGVYSGYSDHKGLRTVIEPAVDLARARGIAIEARLHDRGQRWLPRPAVTELLQSLDIYVCASLHEGTPMPVLEAMACGIPVVSTRVGVLPEIAGPLQTALLVDRTPRALADAFARLAADPELRVEVGAENRRVAEQQTWAGCGEQWAAFFADVLADTRSGEGAMSESAVWERSKAWSARVDRVVAAKGPA